MHHQLSTLYKPCLKKVIVVDFCYSHFGDTLLKNGVGDQEMTAEKMIQVLVGPAVLCEALQENGSNW